MRSMKTFVLATTMLSGAAFAAADKPVIAPAPAWVKPVVLPPKPDKPDEAPIRVVLADQQSNFEAGRTSTYVDLALQIQTPQGLAAGNLSLPWNPETDELTVHKLVIHRDGAVIDILAGGQTFTVVRREPNLESATLDGVLTANIQPEGLQVGDILEYAVTVTSSDPVLKGHIEQMGGTWNGIPVSRAHLAVQWPSTMAVSMRQSGALPVVKAAKAGGRTSVELSLDNVQPVIPPTSAPARFAMGRAIEFSDFKSWADAGALLAPLYDVAAKVPAEGPLRVELEKIKAASADPVKRAEAALALVQDRVRYVALLMGTGGLTPAKAEETWGRRYGDCKAKTALLLALLHELGIEAEPVAANAIVGDGIDQRLPMIGLFNHVLVRAHIGGRAYWLDGTRTGDTSLARIRTPDFGWGLPLVAKDAALVRMIPDPLDQPTYDLSIALDARAGLAVPATIKAQVILRGDDAIGTRLNLAGMTAQARDQTLRDYWKERVEDLEIAKVSANFDPATGSELLSMEGKAKMDWSDGQYWTDFTRVGFQADFSRTAAMNGEAPYAVGYPLYERTVETIQLPPGFSERDIFRKEPIDETWAGLEYRRHASLTDDVFTIEKTVRSVVPEFAAKDAPAAQKRLRELYDLPVAVRRPSGYRMTLAEIGNAKTETLSTAKSFVDRGLQLMDSGQSSAAKADFDAAIKLDPKYIWGFANRALVDVDLGDFKLAQQDIDAAAAIDPENFVMWHAKARLARARNASQEAIAAFSHSIAANPKDGWALFERAQMYQAAGNIDAALLDSDALLKINPKQTSYHFLRASLLRRAGRMDEAAASARALIETDPQKSAIHVSAAQIYYMAGKYDEALKAMDRAIELEPSANLYLGRANFRPKADVAARKADIDKALQMEPDNATALLYKGVLQAEGGNYADAISAYSAVLSKRPKDISLLNMRGISYAKTGDTAHAKADFAAARAVADADEANKAGLLNNLCYEKAMAGVALDRALTECDASLAKEPGDAAALDSRAFVLLRLGRLDEAIADYSAALDKYSNMASSLIGRAIAWSRKGDKQKAQADREAALKIDPNVQKRFEGYGVTM